MTFRRLLTTACFLLLAVQPITAQRPAAAQSKDADQALRARVEQYYTLMQSGQSAEAEKFVTDDTKANFRQYPKPPFRSFEYQSASIGDDGKSATVTVKVEGIAGLGIFAANVPTTWRLVRGKWFIHVPQFGTAAGPPRGMAPKPLPAEVKFEPAELKLGTITDEGVIERRVRVTNISDHTLKLEVVVPGGGQWLKASVTKHELKPQEEAEIVAQFNTVGYSYGFFTQSIVLRSEPGPRVAILNVSAVVGSAPKENKPKDSKQ